MIIYLRTRRTPETSAKLTPDKPACIVDIPLLAKNCIILLGNLSTPVELLRRNDDRVHSFEGGARINVLPSCVSVIVENVIDEGNSHLLISSPVKLSCKFGLRDTAFIEIEYFTDNSSVLFVYHNQLPLLIVYSITVRDVAAVILAFLCEFSTTSMETNLFLNHLLLGHGSEQ